VSVPYEAGTRVDAGVQSVKEIDNKTSHWVAKIPGGGHAEWTVEIINEVENELLGWRSVSGHIGIAGSVQFKDAPGGGTEIKLETQYRAAS